MANSLNIPLSFAVSVASDESASVPPHYSPDCEPDPKTRREMLLALRSTPTAPPRLTEQQARREIIAEQRQRYQSSRLAPTVIPIPPPLPTIRPEWDDELRQWFGIEPQHQWRMGETAKHTSQPPPSTLRESTRKMIAEFKETDKHYAKSGKQTTSLMQRSTRAKHLRSLHASRKRIAATCNPAAKQRLITVQLAIARGKTNPDDAAVIDLAIAAGLQDYRLPFSRN